MNTKTLIVDLDNSFLKIDTLFEIIIANIKEDFLSFIKIFYFLFKGKAQLKDYLSKSTKFEIANLPINEEVVNHIKNCKKKGYQVILVTGSNQIIADKVNKHFDFFDKCYGSSQNINLVGKEKAKFIKETLELDNFAYIGDSKKDFFVWDDAQEVIYVDNNNKKLQKVIQTKYPHNITIYGKDSNFNIFRLIRLHQWVKNFLIFLPSVLAGTILELNNIVDLFTGFLAFSLLASATYILNDLIDLNSDRNHDTKKFRPLAAGDVSIPKSICCLMIFLVLAILLSLNLPNTSNIFLFTYLIITLGYSFFLKKRIILDCIALSILYLIRLLIGSEITGDTITFWFMSFSFFFFLSLAFLKRYIESMKLPESSSSIGGRAYQKSDKDLILGFGQSSGFISILVFSLYLYDKNIIQYQNDYFFSWLIIPLLIYWISRIWMLAGRRMVDDDPVIFAIKDKMSFMILLICFVLFFLSGLL